MGDKKFDISADAMYIKKQFSEDEFELHFDKTKADEIAKLLDFELKTAKNSNDKIFTMSVHLGDRFVECTSFKPRNEVNRHNHAVCGPRMVVFDTGYYRIEANLIYRGDVYGKVEGNLILVDEK